MHKLKKNIFLIAFVLSVLLYLYVRLLDYSWASLIVQPFMMVFLGIHYVVSARKPSKFILLALLFIIVGSLFFIYDFSTESFIVALIFIFISNMLFLLQIVHRMGIIRLRDILVRATPIYILLLILVCSFFTVLLGIKVLIFMYCISLALLLTFAFLQNRTFIKNGTFLMLIGVILIIVRDFFTGLSMLSGRYEDYHLVINVVSHTLALYLICTSLLMAERNALDL